MAPRGQGRLLQGLEGRGPLCWELSVPGPAKVGASEHRWDDVAAWGPLGRHVRVPLSARVRISPRGPVAALSSFPPFCRATPSVLCVHLAPLLPLPSTPPQAAVVAFQMAFLHARFSLNPGGLLLTHLAPLFPLPPLLSPLFSLRCLARASSRSSPSSSRPASSRRWPRRRSRRPAASACSSRKLRPQWVAMGCDQIGSQWAQA